MKALTMSIESNVKPCINLTNNGEIHLEKLVNLIKMYKNNAVYTILYSVQFNIIINICQRLISQT